ncbi:MAG: UDP-N-acetylmuramoyl-tripeptide--D-alanyl-D-alanine ligase [Verrucomicrobia bacterium]|nr:UDP-N-acetylmuramoyl-tripeptide--D-alanyl-D-alanine ligase [Verrucomicrobiota bacterium]
MEPRSLQFVADACFGELKKGSPQTLVSRICTDSRAVQPGDLFIALAGERFDAHNFLADVASKDVAAIVAEKGKTPPGLTNCALIFVEHTRKALGDIASAYRREFQLPFIAVGGSNGKTSTKDLIASVLAQKFPTLASEASFNNDIGVPLTLLKLEPQHKAAVLEVGTNHPGELAPLLRIVRPRYSVVTSIGREHLEFFGDMDGVIREEGTLAELLPVNGKLFVNAESEWVYPILKRARVPVVKVGWSEKCDFSARNLRMSEEGFSFSVAAPRKEFTSDYQIKLLGRHQVLNALLAIAIGSELGLSRNEVQRGLLECRPAKMRMQLWSFDGIRVLDDAYNANVDSMLAALQTLSEIPVTGRRIAVLGEMAELGAHAATSHIEIGRRAAELKIHHIITVGKMAGETANGARNAGCRNVTEVTEVEAVAPVLKELLQPGDLVLLKASRSTRLERVSELLRGGAVK